MKFLEKVKENESTYLRNKKEIIKKLITGEYPKGGRLIVVVGVENFTIFDFYVDYLKTVNLRELNKALNYIIAYTFIKN